MGHTTSWDLDKQCIAGIVEDDYQRKPFCLILTPDSNYVQKHRACSADAQLLMSPKTAA